MFNEITVYERTSLGGSIQNDFLAELLTSSVTIATEHSTNIQFEMIHSNYRIKIEIKCSLLISLECKISWENEVGHETKYKFRL